MPGVQTGLAACALMDLKNSVVVHKWVAR